MRAMCDQIRHRGPDDEGIYVDRRLRHRHAAAQHHRSRHAGISRSPMRTASLWVVFNGEIYNYQELRADLIAQGHRFRTNSDTETLVHLYEEEGVDGLQRLRGMFAFAIWDARDGKLLLARDRFGKKPLYYAVLPQGLYFASELKCLRAAGVPLEVGSTKRCGSISSSATFPIR